MRILGIIVSTLVLIAGPAAASGILIDGCDTGIDDQEYDGRLISERLIECSADANNHGQFVSCVSALGNGLKRDGLITGKQKGTLQSCAADAGDGVVTQDNQLPVAEDSSGRVNAQASIAVPAPGVLTSCSDPDGDPLTVIAHDDPSALGASVTVNENGSFTYNPRSSAELQALAAGETVEDTFGFTISDGNGGTASATVTLTVFK